MQVKSVNGVLIGMALAMTLACSETKAPDVTENVRHALDGAGLSDVHVSQDRDKNVVTLTGSVPSDDDKGRAESIARSQAGSAVVADEIGVRPKGDEGTARKVDSDVDSGIEKNLDAMLVEHKMNHAVRYDVKRSRHFKRQRFLSGSTFQPGESRPTNAEREAGCE